MSKLLFLLAPLYVAILFTDNPIMKWVDKWARK